MGGQRRAGCWTAVQEEAIRTEWWWSTLLHSGTGGEGTDFDPNEVRATETSAQGRM